MAATTEKLSVSIPKQLAKQLRELAPPGEVSAVVTRALDQYVRWQKQRQVIEKSAGIWKDEDHPDLKTPEDTHRFIRELRGRDEERMKRLEDLWRREK